METLRLQRDAELPGLVTITLARPDKLNAVNRQLHLDLQAACRELMEDAAARVVILTGEGRAFSAGADIGKARPGGPRRAPVPLGDPLVERLANDIGNRSARALEDLDQVTIGAVNGLAIGGAVVFLACMDLRIAGESAWFSIPEVDLDLPMTWNSLPRFMRELGPARTKELVMTCDRFSAQQALQWGFVNHVVPDEEVLPRARAGGEAAGQGPAGPGPHQDDDPRPGP